MKRFFSILIPSLILITLFSTDSFAKSPGGGGAVYGFVKDSSSNSPLNYATVEVRNAADSNLVTGTKTDEKGLFVVKDLPFGKYDLKIKFMGYNTVNLRNVPLSPDNPGVPVGEIKMFPTAAVLDGITVTGEKDLVTYKIDKKIVNVNQHMNAKGGTVVDVLKDIPSVRVDMEGNVSLRGSGNFTLLIDGKPEIRDANELLKQLPADAVKNIEIITNPSAKYDREGTAGIINLVMKKEDYFGTNGMVNMTAGNRDKYSGSAQFNVKNSKMNIFASLDGHKRDFHPFSEFTKETSEANGDTKFVVPIMDRYMTSKGYSFKLGTDYNISDSKQFSLSGSYGYYGFDRIFPSENKEYTDPATIEEFFYSKDDFFVGGDYYAATANYFQKYNDNGTHNLNSNLTFSEWGGEVDQTFSKYQTDNTFESRDDLTKQQWVFNDAKRTNLNYQLDYTWPITDKTKVELGGKSETLWKDFNYRMDTLNLLTDTKYEHTEYTNKSEFLQTVQAVYGTVSWEMLGMTYLLGLRGEYYYRNLNQLTMGEEFNFDEFSIYPSLHVSRQFENDQSLQFSYSRRVQRPDDRTLNPFPDYNDDDYISKGNPNLKPQYSNTFELNYRKGFGPSFISLESYFRQTNDLISRTISLTDDNKLLISSVNVDRDYLYGGELSANIFLAKWLRFNLGSNFYSYHLVEKRDGKESERSTNVIDGNMSATITFDPSVRTAFLQLSGYYSGPKITPDGEVKGSHAFSATLRKDLFNRKLTVVLSARDIFKTAKFEMINNGVSFKSYGYFLPESQVVNLSISYRINNFQRRRAQTKEVEMEFQGGGGF